MSKDPKEFKIKVRSSHLSEKERGKLLFECFDILLASKRKRVPQKKKRRKTKSNTKMLHYLTIDNLSWLGTIKVGK